MKLPFVKMHSQGNDYIYLDFLDGKVPQIDFAKLAIKLSDRHFGIGGDGIVLILPDQEGDAYMRIFNLDGSEAESCGSALRAVIAYLFMKTKQTIVHINTHSGLKKGNVTVPSPNPVITVNMGMPGKLSGFADSPYIPILTYKGYPVNMGNPHLVIFSPYLSHHDLMEYGPKIERHSLFPQGINVEFACVNSYSHIDILIWERGSGPTLACGTGACAAVYAGFMANLLSDSVEVKMPGGKVKIDYDQRSNQIYLTGEVDFVFEGKIEI